MGVRFGLGRTKKRGAGRTKTMSTTYLFCRRERRALASAFALRVPDGGLSFSHPSSSTVAEEGSSGVCGLGSSAVSEGGLLASSATPRPGLMGGVSQNAEAIIVRGAAGVARWLRGDGDEPSRTST